MLSKASPTQGRQDMPTSNGLESLLGERPRLSGKDAFMGPLDTPDLGQADKELLF